MVNLILLGSLVINTILVIVKIVIGFIGHSKALIANGIYTLSDLITDILAIFGNMLAKRPSDKKHPYGYGKMEYVTSVMVGVFLLIMGGRIVMDAFSGSESRPTDLVLIVSVVFMVIKYGYAKFMEVKGWECNNSILMASATESKVDAITTLFVVISVLLSKWDSINFLYKCSDNILTFVIGLYIIYVSLRLLWENIGNVIGVSVTNYDYLEEIKALIMESSEVIRVQEMNLIKYGSYNTGSIEVVMKKRMQICHMEKVVKGIERRICNKETRLAYVKISVVSG